MKAILFFLGIIFLNFNIKSQSWVFAERIDYLKDETPPLFSGCDKDGNCYVRIGSRGFADHGGGSLLSYKLVKFNNACQEVWQQDVGEYGNSKSISDMDGNTYLLGVNKICRFDASGQKNWEVAGYGQRSFRELIFRTNGGILVSGFEVSADTMRTFVSGYSEGGQLLSTIYDQKSGLMTGDGMGNYYLVGEGFPDPQTANQGFLYKYDSEGNLIFNKVIPHTPINVLSDQKGNVYVTGWHDRFPIQINNSVISKPGNYLIKYDPTGNLLWYKTISEFGWMSGGSMTFDKDQNLHIAFDYAKIAIDDIQLVSQGSEILMVKVDPSGKILWSEYTSANNTQSSAYGSQIRVSNGGDVILIGVMNGSHRLGTFSLFTGGLYQDFFIGKFRPRNITSLKKQSEIDLIGLKIFPNPSGDIFNLHYKIRENTAYTVTDVQGRKIIHGTLTSQDTKIELRNYPPGVYILEVTSGAERSVTKLVRN